jgi:Squalene-hopene cyclase C-terminal domain/Prenyltransferase and squalene oxidase repeat
MTRTLLAALAALLALPIVIASAAFPETAAVGKGVAFIRTTQLADGGFSAAAGQNADAIFALRAAGIDPTTVTKAGKSPADALRASAPAADKPGTAAKLAVAARAMNMDPKAVNGVDLIARITAAYKTDSGKYGDDDFTQSIAVLGLVCSGNRAALGAKALDPLKAAQLADGGWGFAGASDPDTAAIAVQALVAGGLPLTDAAVVKAIAYFQATQATDGGWGFDPAASNASSTAFVVQALLAVGHNPEGALYTKGAKTPVTFLVGEQQADGSFKGFDAAFATNQAVPALAGRTFCNAVETPITPVATPTAAGSASATATPATATPAITATPVPATATTVRPAATPIPATATPGAATPPATVVAPAPPNTGSGAAEGTGDRGVVWALIAGLGLAGGVLAAAAARRRSQS